MRILTTYVLPMILAVMVNFGLGCLLANIPSWDFNSVGVYLALGIWSLLGWVIPVAGVLWWVSRQIRRQN